MPGTKAVKEIHGKFIKFIKESRVIMESGYTKKEFEFNSVGNEESRMDLE